MRSGLKCFKIFLWICLTNTLHKILLEKFIFGKVAPLKYTHASHPQGYFQLILLILE